MGVFETKTAARQLRTPIAPFKGRTPVTGADLGIRVKAGVTEIRSPEMKTVRKGYRLGMVLPTAINEYEVVSVLQRVRHNANHVFEVAEVATDRSRYLVLRRVPDGAPERISALFRLARVRDAVGGVAAASPIMSGDGSAVAAAWTYQSAVGCKLGWRVFRIVWGNLVHLTSGELQLQYAVAELSIHEGEGEMHITGEGVGVPGTVGIAVPTTAPIVSGVAAQGDPKPGE